MTGVLSNYTWMEHLAWKQPFKSIFIAWRVIIVLACLPIWTFIFFVPSARPRPSWTFKRTIIIHLVRSLGDLLTKTGLGLGRDATRDVEDQGSLKEGVEMVWVPGVTRNLIGKTLAAYADANGVYPAEKIPGYWYGGQPNEMNGSGYVGYHMHGGGLITLSAYPEDAVSSGLRAHCSKTVRSTFLIDYRLSTSAPLPHRNPFPAALLDALAGYRYLVEEARIPPEQILLSGDSAGGNLAVALMRHLIQLNSPTLRKPGALFLASPSVDMSDSHTSRPDPGNSAKVNRDADIVNEAILNSFFRYMRTSYAGPSPNRDELLKSEPFVSPASLYLKKTKGLFKGFPRTFIVAGGSEYFRDEVRTLRDRIKADTEINKNSDSEEWVTYMEPPHAIHDFVSFGFHSPEREAVLKRLGDWL
ncbi:hypothetical protein FRC03_009103 [Tulasnella sp. 419]|nr:hypothetical protein FRC02_009891 [Tulasnella sp. 418]KAG8958468.1 hypothetical protein FRC03_009103 [Tulasnella sp. 419]